LDYYSINYGAQWPNRLTVTVTVAEWVSEPLVLVTVIVNLPDLTDDGTVIDSVDVADPPDANVSDVGLTDTVQPLGVVTVRDTVPLNMLSDFSVIAEVPRPRPESQRRWRCRDGEVRRYHCNCHGGRVAQQTAFTHYRNGVCSRRGASWNCYG